MILLFNQLNMVANSIIILIVLILFSSIVISFIIRNKYRILIGDIHDPEHREKHAFYNDVLNKIVAEYKQVLESKKEDINTFALVDKYYHTELKWLEFGEKFVSKAISLMIVLGLLGTFYGLTLSIGELVQLLSTTGAEMVSDVNSITGGLISSVEGMSVAFITSLFGIGSSVVLTILNIIFNLENKRDSVLIAVEEYLDNTLNIKGDASVFESSMSILAEAMERNFVQVTDVIREQLNVSTEGLIQVSESFGTSMENFDDSLNKFSVNIRDFSEFNYHLKTNIQRMNVSFADLTTGLKENTKELEALTKDIIENN
ncbi:MAG: MotA/TolQ/ExbB proton channel family protein [Clostridiales bacterium]|nr:MotA/TolQ/ExbB proton channel family protein [Clostridiales bacterium]